MNTWAEYLILSIIPKLDISDDEQNAWLLRQMTCRDQLPWSVTFYTGTITHQENNDIGWVPGLWRQSCISTDEWTQLHRLCQPTAKAHSFHLPTTNRVTAAEISHTSLTNHQFWNTSFNQCEGFFTWILAAEHSTMQERKTSTITCSQTRVTDWKNENENFGPDVPEGDTKKHFK